MRWNATNSFVLSRKAEAVRRGRKTSPGLLSVAARCGALGLLAAAEEKNKGGVREVRLGKGKRMRWVFCSGEAYLTVKQRKPVAELWSSGERFGWPGGAIRRGRRGKTRRRVVATYRIKHGKD